VIFLDEDSDSKSFTKKIKNRLSFGRDISTIGITDIINNAIGYGFWLYIASIVSVKDYGEINYFIALGAMISGICLIGSNNSMIVLLAKNIKIHTSLISISLIIGICSSIVFSLITGSIELGFLIIGYIVMNLTIAEITGKKLFRNYFRYIILSKIFFVVLSIILFHIIGIKGIILGIALSSLIFLAHITKILLTEKVDFGILWKERKFVLTNFITSSFDAVSGNLDKIIIVPVLGLISLGNYQFGLQIAGVLMLLPNMIFKYTLPTDSQGSSNKRIKQSLVVIITIITIMLILLVPVVVQDMIPKYSQAIPIIQIAALSAIPNTINFMFLSYYLGMQRYWISLTHSIIYTSTLMTFIVILGSVMADVGLAMSFTLAQCSVTIYYTVLYLRSKDKVNNDYKKNIY